MVKTKNIYRMTAKEYVKSKSSIAIAVQYIDESGDKYWMIKRGKKNQYLATGVTESNAWVNAKNKIVEFLKNKSN